VYSRGETPFPRSLVIAFLLLWRSLPIKAETNPVVIKVSRDSNHNSNTKFQGSRLFFQNGTQFFIRGLSYSNDARSAPGSISVIDTISDELSCTRDIPYLQRLGINTLGLRVVDANADHSGCMSLLQDAGIYVMVRVDGITAQSRVRNGTAITPFDSSFIDHIHSVVDAYQEYSNTLGYYLSGEKNRTDETPLYKAWLIHTKDYIKSKNYRKIPVGFIRRVRFERYSPCGFFLMV